MKSSEGDNGMTTATVVSSEKTKLLQTATSDEEEYKFGPLFGFDTLNQVINLHKVTSLLVFGAACFISGNSSLPALIYTALHGAYGVCWCMRYIVTPDKSFETKMKNKAEFVVSFLMLGTLYWTGGLLMILTNGTNSINGVSFGLPSTTQALLVDGNGYVFRLAAAVFTFGVGLYLTYCSDTQKFYTLKYKKPRALISEGLFARSRNINYLGEMMIYSGDAINLFLFDLTSSNTFLMIYIKNDRY